MSNYIGPKQREIIAVLKQGAELVQDLGRWRIRHDMGKSYFVNRERCVGLYVRGFLMSDGLASSGGFLYRLTEKGKRS